MKSSVYIDKYGINKAITRSIHAGFTKLAIPYNSKILLDAGLRPPELYENYISIVKGDEREAVIAMASIVAKVKRDSFMAKIALKYPGYGFENHVGYGTPAHYKALQNKGFTPIHRLSFLKNMLD